MGWQIHRCYPIDDLGAVAELLLQADFLLPGTPIMRRAVF
jgi:hypothetical protein